MRGPAGGDTVWFVARPSASVSLSVSQSRVDRDLSAERCHNFDAVIETSVLDMTSGFKIARGKSRIIVHDVRMSCVLHCFQHVDGRHVLQMSSSSAAVEYGTGFHVAGDNSSDILVNISKSTLQALRRPGSKARSGSKATGIGFEGPGSNQLYIEDVNISELSTGVPASVK